MQVNDDEEDEEGPEAEVYKIFTGLKSTNLNK